MKRYYQQVSTGRFLKRVDGNPPLTPAQAQADAAAEYGLPQADILVLDDPEQEPDLATGTTPPARPSPLSWEKRYQAARTLEQRVAVLAQKLSLSDS